MVSRLKPHQQPQDPSRDLTKPIHTQQLSFKQTRLTSNKLSRGWLDRQKHPNILLIFHLPKTLCLRSRRIQRSNRGLSYTKEGTASRRDSWLALCCLGSFKTARLGFRRGRQRSCRRVCSIFPGLFLALLHHWMMTHLTTSRPIWIRIRWRRKRRLPRRVFTFIRRQGVPLQESLNHSFCLCFRWSHHEFQVHLLDEKLLFKDVIVVGIAGFPVIDRDLCFKCTIWSLFHYS